MDASFDIIAIGGGLAGLAAMSVAKERGLSALVIEKTAALGGVTAYSAGQLWVPGSYLEEEAGIEDSPHAGAAYLRRLGMGFADEAHVQGYANRANDTLVYFRDLLAAKLRIVDDLPDYYCGEFPDARREGRLLEVDPFPGASLGEWRDRLRTSPHVQYRLLHEDMWKLGGIERSHNWDRTLIKEREQEDALCMGTGLAALFLRGAIEAGATIMTSASVEQILTENGAAIGVRMDDGREIRATRGIIVATGAYDWDARAMRGFEGIPDVNSAAPPSVVGDHFRLTLPLGARIVSEPKPMRLGYPIPNRKDDGMAMTGIFRAVSYPYSILVNGDGKRFCDESFYPAIGHALKVIDGRRQAFKNWPCWWVFDTRFRDEYSFSTIAPGVPFPPEWDVVTADTLEELAEKIGVDPATFCEQVARFNAGCENGVDPEFGRGERAYSQVSYGDHRAEKHPNLGPVQKAPFHAMRPVLVGTGIPTTGLDTNTDGQVLNHRGEAIPGLYAAGNSSAMLEVGGGYQSGIANMRSLIIAKAAVYHAGAAR